MVSDILAGEGNVANLFFTVWGRAKTNIPTLNPPFQEGGGQLAPAGFNLPNPVPRGWVMGEGGGGGEEVVSYLHIPFPPSKVFSKEISGLLYTECGYIRAQ